MTDAALRIASHHFTAQGSAMTLDTDQSAVRPAKTEGQKRMGIDLTQVTRAHINIRDARRKLREEFEKQDADLKASQGKLEAVMLEHMNTHGMESVRTEAGTFYRQEEITPSASDWNALYDWIKDNDAWDCLERRIKKTFVKEYQEAHDGGLPAGVSVYREYVVRVRRA
jgi:hypothetical protein